MTVRQLKAEFPPLKIAYGTGTGFTFKDAGWMAVSQSSARPAAATMVTIDLSGLSLQEKVLGINSLAVASLPTFDNTFPAPATGGGVLSVTEIHLVTSTPIAVAPARAMEHQLQMEAMAATWTASSFSSNNGYILPVPGFTPQDYDNVGYAFRPGLNLGVEQIFMSNYSLKQSNRNTGSGTTILPVDAATYGAGQLMALDTLYCYKFVFVSWFQETDMQLDLSIGPSMIQMIGQDLDLSDTERLFTMDNNFTDFTNNTSQ